MAIIPKQKIRERTLANAKDVVVALITQEVFAIDATATATTETDVTAAADGNMVPFLCPLHKNPANGQWSVWADGETIDGFAHGDEGYSLHESGKIRIYATGEVFGLVIKGGQVPLDQVPLPFGQTQSNLETQLKTGMRSRGFHITNTTGAS